jgi:Flagellar basal body L-ring protein
MAPVTTGGSLFQAGQAMNYGYQPMFEDRRPRSVGDTLTILLQENVSASKSSSASANRNGSAGMGLLAMPGSSNSWLGNGKADFNAEGKKRLLRQGRGGSAQHLYRHHHGDGK